MNYILVVDDSPVDRQLVRGLLEKPLGFRVEFASDGLEALEHVTSELPYLIVTDMQMPNMDGLSLVKELRGRYPFIPIILMTAYGSEEIALEALVTGAADYVPKHRLGTDLLPAAQSVLSVAAGDHRHEQITRYVRYLKIDYEIPCEQGCIALLADQLQQLVVNAGVIDPTDRMRLGKCIVEALSNAVKFGAARADASPGPMVSVDAELTPEQVKFVIRDTGAGFDAQALANPRTQPGELTADKGRGLNLIQLFMDEVRFNEAGNQIEMVKRRK